MTDFTAEIKKNLQSKKLVLGKERTLKQLKRGNLAKVFITENSSEKVEEDIKHYAELGSCDIEHLAISNKEFGVICKKPFSVSIAGLMK